MSPLAGPRYGAAARALHWMMAPLVGVQLALGFLGERLEHPQLARLLLVIHFQLGVALLVLLVVRVGWRIRTRARSHAPPDRRWHRRAASLVHVALYLLLMLLPASGYVIWIWMDAPRELLGIVQVPALFTPPTHDESARALAWYIHVYGAYALLLLVAGHAGAAIWHHRARRDASRAPDRP